MNKYIVLSALSLVICLALGCQNCGYKTAHCSRYQTLVGTTRLASPQTNCRFNTCNVCSSPCNTCNPCNACTVQAPVNNGQFCSNSYAQNAYPIGYYQPNPETNVSLLDGTQQTAQSETPLRWRSVTEEEQQYANSSVNPTSAGIASALSAPAFGSPAPASVVDPRYSYSYNNAAEAGVAQALSRRPGPAPGPAYSYRNDAATGVAEALSRRPGPAPGMPPQYAGSYSGPYSNSSPRATMGVNSALNVPGHPLPPQYSNSSPRATMGVNSALSNPGYPSSGAAPQYSGQYPDQYSNAAAGGYPMNSPSYGAQTPTSDSDSLRWRRVSEEEQQQYYNSSTGAMQGSGYGDEQPLTVPVYPEDNAQTPQTPQAPEIDPNALPSLTPQSGTF